MTESEAIEILIGIRLVSGYSKKREEALDMAIAALEKQEGKKPINVRLADGRLGDNGIKSGECPSCGREVDGNLLGIYCGSCGQKLDWSDAYGTD